MGRLVSHIDVMSGMKRRVTELSICHSGGKSYQSVIPEERAINLYKVTRSIGSHARRISHMHWLLWHLCCVVARKILSYSRRVPGVLCSAHKAVASWPNMRVQGRACLSGIPSESSMQFVACKEAALRNIMLEICWDCCQQMGIGVQARLQTR